MSEVSNHTAGENGLGILKNDKQKLEIVIGATFTGEPIIDSLSFIMKRFNPDHTCRLAPYNQIIQQLLDFNSLMNQNSGINILLIRLEDWLRTKRTGEEQSEIIESSLAEKLEQNATSLVEALKAAISNSRAAFFVYFCPGSTTITCNQKNNDLLLECEKKLTGQLNTLTGVYPVMSGEIFHYYRVEKYYDSHADKLGHIPYTPEFFTALGLMLVRKIFALKRKIYKVIVLDCDETLWKGVCSEDGTDGVLIDQPRLAFQQLITKQYQAGVLICLCSKNIEQDVLDVFKKRKEMLLKWEHITAYKINWNRKSGNIRELAAELNLGLDSFIIIDDNPAECLEIKNEIPEALVLPFPKNDEEIITFIKHTWVFDHLKLTSTDSKRTDLYRQNIQRIELEKQSPSLVQFIRDLKVEIDFVPLASGNLNRASQLSQRVNQFNFTTIRRSENEMQEVLASSEGWLITVRDRFGDYGEVGLIIFKQSEKAIELDTFLISCRALGKNLERDMLARLGKMAVERSKESVRLPFISSAKNEPAFRFITRIMAHLGKGDCLIKEDGSSLYEIPGAELAKISYEQYSEHETDNPPVDLPVNLPDKQKILIAKENDPGSDNNQTDEAVKYILKNLSDISQVHAAVKAESNKILQPQAAYIPPVTPIEKQLSKIWEDIFGIKNISIHDDFFEIGGDSIKAIQILSQVQESFQIELPISILFENAFTISELAATIETYQFENIDQTLLEKEIELIKNLSDEEIQKLLVETEMAE